MRPQAVLFFLIAFFVGGCQFLPGHRAVKIIEDNSQAVAGKVLRPTFLDNPGKIVIKPFTAGEKVAATDSLDRISLFISKGIIRILDNPEARLSTFSPQYASQADLILIGRVIEQKEKKVFRGLGWRKDLKVITVEGEVVSVENNQPIINFTHSLTTLEPTEDFYTLGERVGLDLGRYLESLWQVGTTP